MQNFTGWLQITVGALIVLLNGGVFIYVLRSFKTQIDCKADKALCNERHERVNVDLSRGREEFKDLRQDIKTLTLTQGETNTLLGQIKQQIEDHLKKNGPR